MAAFIGRERELRALEDLYRGRASAFVPIYGRRRLLRGLAPYLNQGESLSQLVAKAVRREVDRRREQEHEAIEEARRGAVQELEQEDALDVEWERLACLHGVGHA